MRYRGSKLINYLRESFGGESLTSIVANISPSVNEFAHTVFILNLATRAREIRNHPKLNEEVCKDRESMRLEIKMLHKMLEKATKGGETCQSTFESTKDCTQVDQSQVVTENKASENAKEELWFENKARIIFEEMVLRSFESLVKMQSFLELELAKKEGCLNTIRKALSINSKNELQYKTIIKLNSDRYKRRNFIEKLLEETRNLSSPEVKINNAFFALQDCYEIAVREKTSYEEIVDSMPVLAKIYEENIFLKERLEQLETQGGYGSDTSLIRTLNETSAQCQHLLVALQESIQERSVLSERFETTFGLTEGELEVERRNRLRLRKGLQEGYERTIEDLQGENSECKETEKKLCQEIYEGKKKIEELNRTIEENEMEHSVRDLLTKKEVYELESRINSFFNRLTVRLA